MILLILTAALILRLLALDQSLWLDEGINAFFAKSLSYKSLIFNYSLGDFHPPLYHLVLKFWISIFGNSEIALRMPSVLSGVGVVFVTFLIAKKLFDKKTALIAATLIATGPLHIYYSQEARMYMLTSLFSALSVYFFVSILKKDKLFYWIGFIFSTVLMLYCDYLPYLLIPTFIIYLITFRPKIQNSTLRSFLPAFLIILFLISPWLLIFPSQLKVGLSAAAASPAWSSVVGGSNLKDLMLIFVKFTIGRISNDNNLLYALLFSPAAIFVIILLLLSLLRISAQRSFLWFYLIVPTLLAFIISFFVPIFAYFRLVFILPAFYILLASAIYNINWKTPIRLLLTITLFINLLSSSIYLVNPKFQREDWKSATKYVSENKTSKTIVLFESTSSIGPFDYYNNGSLEAQGVLDSFSPKYENVFENVKKYTQSKNKVFLFQYLLPITDPQGLAFESLTNLGYTNTKTKDFNGVGFIYEFKK